MASEKKATIRNILLWIIQVLLSLSFFWSAWMKLFLPADQLATMWPWTGDYPGLTKLTGVVDLLIGLGLVLPMLLRILPVLTLYAAYATIALMLVATAFHIVRGEASSIGVNVVFLVLAVVIARGRRN